MNVMTLRTFHQYHCDYVMLKLNRKTKAGGAKGLDNIYSYLMT